MRRVYETVRIIDLYTITYSQQFYQGKSHLWGVFGDTIKSPGITSVSNLWYTAINNYVMKNILVFCSANDLEEKYVTSARELAQLIPKNKYNLVWGGSNTGIMKLMASTVQEYGGKIIGVSMELLKHKARSGADEMIIAKDLSERQRIMLERSDAIISLPGGIGTLNEITAVLEMKKHKSHDKPVVVLNSDNFYEGLKVQLQKMKDDGFLPRQLDKLIYFADKPQEVFDYINPKLNAW